MESYRIYKSLPLDDFMDNVQFVIAKCGLLITPLIQNVNYLRKALPRSDHYWKKRFMDDVRSLILKEESNLTREVIVQDMGSFGFWIITPVTCEGKEGR